MNRIHRLIMIIVFSVALFLSIKGSDVSLAGSANCPAVTCVYVPLANNPPTPVSIYEAEAYISREEWLWMVGDVINTSASPVYDVSLELRIYGDQTIVEDTKTVLKATLPGQLNPFHFTPNVDWEWGMSYEVSITGWSWESDEEYRVVTTIITGLEDLYYGTRVYVEVLNDEPVSLADVRGTVWSLEQGASSGFRLLADCLAPNESVDFTEFLWAVSGTELATIQVAAQGVVEPCIP